MSSDKVFDIPKEMAIKIEKIKNNNKDSSVTIAYQAIQTYIDLFDYKLPSDSLKLKKIIIYTGERLVQSQPEMAIIFNLVNSVFIEIENINQIEEMISKVKKICKLYKENLDETNNKISINAAKFIKNNSSILTHSYSQTVLLTLIKAFKLGKKFHVYVTESRPKKEGIDLSKRLIENNIPTTLIVDSAVYEIMSRIDLVLVGADIVSDKFVINKIGTYGIALSAKKMKKTCCVLCGTQKFIKGCKKQINRNQNPYEILKSIPKNLNVYNVYFDRTPLDFFSYIISEKGKTPLEKIVKNIENISIHPKLNSYL